MVVIQCPHCAKSVELESGAFGLFDCPYCDEEFEYGSKRNSDTLNEIPDLGVNTTLKVGLGLLLGSIVATILGFTLLFGAINGFSDSAESIECEDGGNSTGGGDSVPGNPFSFEFWGIDNCSSEGDYGLGSLCCGIILILLGIGIGISGIISLVTGAASDDKKVIIIQK